MLHRIFIAINLPESIKKELVLWQGKWAHLPVRWTKPENLHITLVFLGNMADKELEGLKIKVGEIAKKHTPFSLNFTRIVYGPSKEQPRMIWVIAEESNELLSIQKDIFGNLVSKSLETKFPHITLGRIREWEFKRIDPEEKPAINEEISLEFPVSSIEIMESKLKKSGPEYTIVKSVELL